MSYDDFAWIDDSLAVGAMVESDEALPFDAILSLVPFAPLGVRPLATGDDLEYRWHAIMDQRSGEGHDEIVRRFEAAAAEIDHWLREGRRVLVHCQVGASRSVTAVIWYLVRYRGYSWDQALALVRERRPIARPTIWFEIPLRLALGEPLSEAWLEEHMDAYQRHMAEATGADFSVDDIRAHLEQQGTLAQLRQAAS